MVTWKMHVAGFFHGKTSSRNAPKSLKRLAGLIWQASYRNRRDVEKEKSLDAVLLRRMFYVKRREAQTKSSAIFSSYGRRTVWIPHHGTSHTVRIP